MAIREWVKENVGLLEDERYVGMTDTQLAAWEVLMKAVTRLPGEIFRDKSQMAFLLRRYGRNKVDASIEALDRRGWFIESDGGIKIRGWDKYQLLYRGPSDSPEAKASRNAARPTSDAERKIRAAEAEQRKREEEAKRRANTPVVSFKEAMAAAGFHPPVAPPLDGSPVLDGGPTKE